MMRLPAINHALIVMGWYVEIHEVYSSFCFFRGKGEDQVGLCHVLTRESTNIQCHRDHRKRPLRSRPPGNWRWASSDFRRSMLSFS